MVIGNGTFLFSVNRTIHLSPIMKKALLLLPILLLTTSLRAELQTKQVGGFISIKQIDARGGYLQWKALRVQDISAIECVPQAPGGTTYAVTILLVTDGAQSFEKVTFNQLTQTEADAILQQVTTLLEKSR